jgi:hypothetical protein
MQALELQRLVGAVRKANLQGRLFYEPECVCQRQALNELVREGALFPVCGTSTSIRGYVALPVETFAAVNGTGGDA